MQGISVFQNIGVALTCTTKVLKENLSIEELGLKDNAQPVRLAHIQIGDKLIRLREAFNTLDTSRSGKISLSDIRMAFRIHVHRDLSNHDLRAICSSHGVNAPVSDLPIDQIFINFDEFCSLMSEYKQKAGDQPMSWDNLVTKTMHFFNAVVSPLTRVASWVGHSLYSARCRTHSGSLCVRQLRAGCVPRRLHERAQLAGADRHPHAQEKRPHVLQPGHLLLKATHSHRGERYGQFTGASVRDPGHGAVRVCNVVLCVQRMQPDVTIDGEAATALAIKDYNRGRSYLSDLANREGIPVHDEITEAVECVIQKCKVSK